MQPWCTINTLHFSALSASLQHMLFQSNQHMWVYSVFNCWHNQYFSLLICNKIFFFLFAFLFSFILILTQIFSNFHYKRADTYIDLSHFHIHFLYWILLFFYQLGSILICQLFIFEHLIYIIHINMVNREASALVNRLCYCLNVFIGSNRDLLILTI